MEKNLDLDLFIVLVLLAIGSFIIKFAKPASFIREFIHLKFIILYSRCPAYLEIMILGNDVVFDYFIYNNICLIITTLQNIIVLLSPTRDCGER